MGAHAGLHSSAYKISDSSTGFHYETCLGPFTRSCNTSFRLGPLFCAKVISSAGLYECSSQFIALKEVLHASHPGDLIVPLSALLLVPIKSAVNVLKEPRLSF